MKKYISSFYCPFCKGVLEVTHQDRYQDLGEHVSDPNGKPSIKDGYECMNSSCIAHKSFIWIEDGDFFSKKPENLDHREWADQKRKAAGSNNYHSIGSWNYYYQRGKDAIESKKFKLNLYWYIFSFYPREKGWDYPIEERHMPHLWKWKVEIWKKAGNGYTHLIPFWRMVTFCVKSFKKAYSSWEENNDKRSLKEANELVRGISFGVIDDRFYKKLTVLYIAIFHPQKRRKVIHAHTDK